MGNSAAKLLEANIRTYIEIQNACDECAPELREVVRDMLDICRDPDAAADEKERAISTILEALFPAFAADLVEGERMRLADDDSVELESQMDAEEARFAENVRRIMQAKGMTQTQLAEKSGVSQPAISNMLNRQCRPQMRTVLRLAAALGVAPHDLWPGLQVES